MMRIPKWSLAARSLERNHHELKRHKEAEIEDFFRGSSCPYKMEDSFHSSCCPRLPEGVSSLGLVEATLPRIVVRGVVHVLALAFSHLEGEDFVKFTKKSKSDQR